MGREIAVDKKHIRRMSRIKRYLEDNEDDDDDSDKDDSDKEFFDKIKQAKKNNNNKAVVYWWYDPTVYYRVYDLSRVFMPTFVSPILPYVELNLSSAFLG